MKQETALTNYRKKNINIENRLKDLKRIETLNLLYNIAKVADNDMSILKELNYFCDFTEEDLKLMYSVAKKEDKAYNSSMNMQRLVYKIQKLYVKTLMKKLEKTFVESYYYFKEYDVCDMLDPYYLRQLKMNFFTKRDKQSILPNKSTISNEVFVDIIDEYEKDMKRRAR